MNHSNTTHLIKEGKTYLGIELGSTRIKAVLIASDNSPVAYGEFDWENELVDGIWTYSLDKVNEGLQACYTMLSKSVEKKYGVELTKIGSIGISAMMHGYLAFDRDGNLIEPFRTWRNTMTYEQSKKLTELFCFNVPQRWSIAHLYHSICQSPSRTKEISYMTTLAGYVHRCLTGEHVLGIGDASGMFPINTVTKDYDSEMVEGFREATEKLGHPTDIRDIFPKPLCAGESAGCLTEAGALFLDATGRLKPGIPLCPPEGDAGTGMVSTNCVKPGYCSVSAGTSIFAMLVLERPLTKVHEEIDIVTTPEGKQVAMVHCNNCTSEINAWVDLFDEVIELSGHSIDKSELFYKLNKKSLEGASDCAGLLVYNYLSGEPITGFEEGRPLTVRNATEKLGLANFMRTQIYSALATTVIGMDILKDEGARISAVYCQGGLFKTPGVGQRYLSASLNTAVSSLATAGEGGAWGMALLAKYMKEKDSHNSLGDFLENIVFKNMEINTHQPLADDVAGFDSFLSRYKDGLSIEREAVKHL